MMNLPSLLAVLSPITFSATCVSVYTALYSNTKKSPPSFKHLALIAAFSGYIFLVLSVTLLFRSFAAFNIELDPIASYRRALNAPHHLAVIEIRNIILNIMMFMPLGFMLPIASEKLRKIYLIIPLAVFFTFTIEATQYLTSRGVFALEDMLLNTMGAIIGFTIYKIIHIIKKVP